MRFASHGQENAAAAMLPSALAHEYAALMIRLRIFGFKNNLLVSQREIAGGPSKRRRIVAGGA
jgi:hypothetical protein